MANVKTLSKLRSTSRICKISAVIIGVIGFVATALYVSSIIPLLRQYQEGQNSFEYLSFILPLFLFIIPTLFFVVTLYAIAVIMDFMGAETKTESKQQEREKERGNELNDEEELEIVPLPADTR